MAGFLPNGARLFEYPGIAMAYYESPDGSVRVELKNRGLAALFSWLLPGAGQYYQGRKQKAFIYCVPILLLYFVGLFLSGGKCVYASFSKEDYRWQYFFQQAVGAPTLPALVQYFSAEEGKDPLWVTARRYPEDSPLKFRKIEEENYQGPSLADGFMAAPAGPSSLDNPDVLAAWYAELGHQFDIGSLYTVVAGLLNILVIYDAFSGPAILESPEEESEADE